MNGIALMTPSQITRSLALRRYAFAKPVQQIADEAGLRYDQVRDALKGLPMHISVVARLSGYLRQVRSDRGMRVLDRPPDEAMGEGRRFLLRRLARARVLLKRLTGGVRLRKVELLRSFTDDMLRAYISNVEDMLKREILRLYPTIAQHWKFCDDMQPWEYVERIDHLKNDPKARNAILNYQREAQARASRPQANAA